MGYFMTLSIIIPSFQRSDLLFWRLTSLSKQTFPQNYEILVINDGIKDETEEVCKQFNNLNIRYIFSGQRNLNGEIHWRIPCYAINIGIKQATGKFIILTCPEIFHLDNCIMSFIKELENNPKQMIITKGKDDRDGMFLTYLKSNNENNILDYYYALPHRLMTEFPFFMGLDRQEVLNIGGYDEDFGIGYCWDDVDFVDRIKNNGNPYKTLGFRIVHLFHPRLRYGLDNTTNLWKRNEKLYHQKKGIIKRNIDKNWGRIDE